MRLNEREICGGTEKAGTSSTPVTLSEREKGILIMKGGSSFGAFEISAASARVMARNLQRLARRIEARAASAMSASGQDAGERLEAKPASATGEAGDAR